MDILEVAILEMCRKYKQASFPAEEVVQTMYPEDWRLFLPDTLQKAWEMYLEGVLILTQNGESLDKTCLPVGSFYISKPK